MEKRKKEMDIARTIDQEEQQIFIDHDSKSTNKFLSLNASLLQLLVQPAGHIELKVGFDS